MDIRAKLLRGALTLAVALAAGHVVQVLHPERLSSSLRPLPAPNRTPQVVPETVPVSASLDNGSSEAQPLEITSVAAGPDPSID